MSVSSALAAISSGRLLSTSAAPSVANAIDRRCGEAGGVVDAIAVLAPGDLVEGVLEEPTVVGEPVEVIERRLVQAARGGHAAGRHAGTLAAISRPASSRYWSATTGQSSCGAVAAAAAAIF